MAPTHIPVSEILDIASKQELVEVFVLGRLANGRPYAVSSSGNLVSITAMFVEWREEMEKPNGRDS